MAKEAVPPIHVVASRGARIAYQHFGNGSVDLVGIPPVGQNIELSWEWPQIRAMLERLGEISRYLHFDRRGTGSSERELDAERPESLLDICAVMDSAGVDCAHLLGISEGGLVALRFAHAFPDRVRSIVLLGAGQAALSKDATEADRQANSEAFDEIAENWGTGDSIAYDLLAPSQGDNAEFRRWVEKYERRATSPRTLRRMLTHWELDDVRTLLSELDVPVLLLHRTKDGVAPVEIARLLCDAIPRARLIEYEGTDHYMFSGDVETWMRDLEEWLTGSVADRPPIHTGKPHIRVLGEFAVEIGNRQIPSSMWSSRFARQILKRLVVARGWPVTREQLIDQLWPDEADMRKLSARLSVHLSGLRRILGDAVVSNRETVRLDLEVVDVDIERYMAVEGDESIVECFEGTLLPEDFDEEWTTALRSQCRARFVDAAHRLVAMCIDAADHAGARDLGYRLIAIDRYDDAAHRTVVRAQAALGLVAETRSAHERWAKSMAEIDTKVPSLEEFVRTT